MRRNRRRKSSRQRAWEYMRRNRIFAVNDVLLILEDMSERSFKRFLQQLSRAGYVKQISGGHAFRSRVYKLLRNTGVIAPRWIDKQSRLYDPNIQQMQLKDASVKLPVTVEAPSAVVPVPQEAYDQGRIISILEDGACTLLSLQQRSGVPSARFASALHALKQSGEVVQAGRENGVPVYKRSRE
ncbi:MAG: hypothetical protein L3J47_12100 [Sulfurovum sp.]|nr:hypothetical protein [Sulfurovum sp.]